MIVSRLLLIAAVVAAGGIDLVFSAWRQRSQHIEIEQLRDEIRLEQLRLRSLRSEFQFAITRAVGRSMSSNGTSPAPKRMQPVPEGTTSARIAAIADTGGGHGF